MITVFLYIRICIRSIVGNQVEKLRGFILLLKSKQEMVEFFCQKIFFSNILNKFREDRTKIQGLLSRGILPSFSLNGANLLP